MERNQPTLTPKSILEDLELDLENQLARIRVLREAAVETPLTPAQVGDLVQAYVQEVSCLSPGNVLHRLTTTTELRALAVLQEGLLVLDGEKEGWK